VAEDRIDAMPSAAQAVMRGASPGAPVSSAMHEQDPAVEDAALPYAGRARACDHHVTGSLVNRGAWLGSNSGATSLRGDQIPVAHAAADPHARPFCSTSKALAEAVVGVQAAAAIREAATQKPVRGGQRMAASAAYALAAGAARSSTRRPALSARCVVMLHLDHSSLLDKKESRRR